MSEIPIPIQIDVKEIATRHSQTSTNDHAPFFIAVVAQLFFG